MESTPTTSFARWESLRISFPILGLMIGLLNIGCGQSNKPILPSITKLSSEASGEATVIVVHPEYANWSQFPVGTQVTRFRIVSNETGKVEVTTVLKLTEKTEEYVEVVSQVNVQRSGEPLQENPSETARFPASFRLPNGLNEAFFQRPSNNAKLIGKEIQTIGEKSIQTDVFEWTEINETGPMSVKLWRSDEIPGRIVRQEMLIESSQIKTVEEIRDLKCQFP